MPKKQTQEGILTVSRADQYNTVAELFERSQPNSIYYTLLVLSSFIVASGLLLNNSAIVIGGMLVTPMLTPVLVAALGLAVGELQPVYRVGLQMLKSFGITVGGSLLLAVIFGEVNAVADFGVSNSMRNAVLYFIVAVASGVAATFAWIRKEVAEVLPGVAIAVSLVPPLSLVGIWLSNLAFDEARFYFLIFLFNLIGILVGSLVVFSLLKFYRVEQTVHEISEEQEDTKSKSDA